MRAKTNSPSPAKRQVQAQAPKSKFLSVTFTEMQLLHSKCHLASVGYQLTSAVSQLTSKESQLATGACQFVSSENEFAFMRKQVANAKYKRAFGKGRQRSGVG
jgi:hypothetical protein